MKHQLDIDSIRLEFQNRKILSDIYVKSETGKITGLLGRNGQGKSCLLKIIYGSLKCESKSTRIDNKSFFSLYKRPDLLTYLPQTNFIPSSINLKKVFYHYEIDFEQFHNVFPEFKTRYKSSMYKFSEGQRRLIEVFLAIKMNSKFTLLDEPFSQLMPLHIEKVISLINIEKSIKGFIITDHSYRTYIDLCDYLFVLKDGKTYSVNNLKELELLGYINPSE
ncbi:MAG: ATP-binding cassette domain-containing protein [Bacteroidetes bacterium]|nr:ATP-binding cassette domain-containing protein [Bacteroidota bacterium]